MGLKRQREMILGQNISFGGFDAVVDRATEENWEDILR
jgi:hypothetical protein